MHKQSLILNSKFYSFLIQIGKARKITVKKTKDVEANYHRIKLFEKKLIFLRSSYEKNIRFQCNVIMK